MICLFIFQFFSTGFMILLNNAYFNEFHMPQFLIAVLPKGIYPDLTFEWYSNVGKAFIFTMGFNIGWPIAAFLMLYLLKLYSKLRDRGCSKEKTMTKAKTIQKFIELYSGPEFQIYTKYAALINVIFVTFVYGAALPLLFPIAEGFFISLYLIDKLLITYRYKIPSMVDVKLH